MSPTSPLEPHPDPSRGRGRLLTAVLLLAGLLLFAVNFDPQRTTRYLVAVAVALALVLPPGLRGLITRRIDRLRQPSPRQRRLTFAAILAASAAYFRASAALAGRAPFPKLFDEYMYLLQARLLASGHLWTAPHPLAPFFDSFNVITRPVYAAAYFPGTALLYVPGVWLHLPPWVISVAILSLAVATLHLLATDLFDGVAGLLAVLMALALYQVRSFSLVTESHPAMLLLLVLGAWLYARWRHTRHVRWLAAFGAAAGWAAITRPLDAVCLVLPICTLVAWDIFRAPRHRLTTRLSSLAVIAAAASPFLLLQFVFDKGVTGHYLQTPFVQYARTNFPDLSFGYHPNPSPAPSASPLPQVRDYYRSFCESDLPSYAREPFVKTWLSYRFAPAANIALPAHAFYFLIPLGIAALCRRPLPLALVAGGLLFSLLYTFYPSYLLHYGLVCVPAFFVPCLAGEAALRQRLPRAWACAPSVAIAVFCLASLPELRGARDPFFPATMLADVNAKLARLDHVPAVVLFHYDPGQRFDQEPVYNLDAVNPDDAPIIRAQDLGPAEDRRIFSYYAEHQPDRFFYLYNRTTAELTPLGYARDLSR